MNADTLPVDMVSDEWDVEAEREEFPGDEEEHVEKHVQGVLGEHERVQAVALIDGVLIVGLQLVERDDLRMREGHTVIRILRTYFVLLMLIMMTKVNLIRTAHILFSSGVYKR